MFSRFLEKFYPFKDFLSSLQKIYTYLQSQLSILTYEKKQETVLSEGTHTELVVELSGKQPYSYVGMKLDDSANQVIDLEGYSAPIDILSIDSTPIEYGEETTLTNGATVVVSPLGTILSSEKFLNNVVSKTDKLYTKFGFLFGLTNLEEIESLFMMYRFGATKEQLSKFFSTDSIYSSTDYSFGLNTWGTITWATTTNWGSLTKIYKSNHYIVETIKTRFPMNYLNETLPPWLSLEIHTILSENTGEVELSEDSFTVSEVIDVEDTLTISDTILKWVKWKTGKWGSNIWKEKESFKGAFYANKWC